MFFVHFALAILFSASKSLASGAHAGAIELRALSPEQQAGQLLIFGVHEVRMTQELSSFLKQTHAGGFIFFKRNIQDLVSFQALLKDVKKASETNRKLVPFFSIDEEGGQVSRLPFFPRVPSASALGFSKNPDIARTVGTEVGAALSRLGLNLNLAPVLDLGRRDSFLKSRTFSSSSHVVSQLGVEFSLGLASQGILPCAKHFPGMANSTSDPHFQVSRGYFPKPRGFKQSLSPFEVYAQTIPHGTMMVSHLIYPQLDPRSPAVYSRKIYKLIRDRIRFDGLIITDDLQMAGARHTNGITLKENVFNALMAGADLVMVSWSRKAQREVHLYLAKMIREGKFPKATLHAKLDRIQKAKEWIQSNQNLNVNSRSLASQEETTDFEQSPTKDPSEFIQMGLTQISSKKLEHVWRKLRAPQKNK